MARKDYWTRRALADEAAAERLARRASAEMQRAYRAQYEAVLREIEGLMAELAEGGTPTRTQLWNYARWRRLEEQLRTFAGEASRQCEQKITDCLDEVFRVVIGTDVAAVGGAAWQASVSPKAVLETAWSGAHYSARVWRNTAAIAQRVREDVTEMIVQGKGISQLRRRVMEDFSVAYSEADRLVRTEAAYVRNQAALARYRQSGRRRVRWITGESDGRECAVCRERDGQEYDIDAAPRLPAHPNCRCCYAPVVEAGLTGENVSGIMNSEPPMKTIGATSPNNPNVENPETGEAFHYVYGRRPTYPSDHTMAGYGCKTGRQIDDIDRLVEYYNTPDAKRWQKEKAQYWVYDQYGEERQVELHWYQHPDIGKVEYKVKRKGGRMYVDEWND